MKYSERTEKRIQLKSMPGWKVHWACSRFVCSFEIFRRNSIELLTFLGNPPSFSFQFLPDEEARIQKIESDTESLRRIHNYVASAKTLIDHCRRIKSKYLQSDSQSKYDELIKDDFTHPRAQLIINLRDFMLHVDLPSICNRVKWLEGSSRIALLPDRLLKWEKWSSGVKGYLLSFTNQEEYLLLEELVAEYNEKTNRFSAWLLDEIVSCNHNDLENVYKINDDILESVRENGLVSDPLIVQFFTRGFRLMGSS